MDSYPQTEFTNITLHSDIDDVTFHICSYSFQCYWEYMYAYTKYDKEFPPIMINLNYQAETIKHFIETCVPPYWKCQYEEVCPTDIQLMCKFDMQGILEWYVQNCNAHDFIADGHFTPNMRAIVANCKTKSILGYISLLFISKKVDLQECVDNCKNSLLDKIYSHMMRELTKASQNGCPFY